MDVEKEVQRFKMELLRKMPFYGDILMHLVFVEDKRIPTAATNGKIIWYNPNFLSGLKPGERNFVLMHEVLHVVLRHINRSHIFKEDPARANIACRHVRTERQGTAVARHSRTSKARAY